MYNRAYKVEDGIVYDTDTAEKIYRTGSEILAITPDGHYFLAFFVGLITGWQVTPFARMSAVSWAIRKKAPDAVLERLGVRILPTPDVPADKPYEPYHACQCLSSREKSTYIGYLLGRKIGRLVHKASSKLFANNWFISTAQFLFKNPDGRFFLYDGMILLGRFTFEETRPMSQLQALQWTIRNGDSWHELETLGYIPDHQHNPQPKDI